MLAIWWTRPKKIFYLYKPIQLKESVYYTESWDVYYAPTVKTNNCSNNY